MLDPKYELKCFVSVSGGVKNADWMQMQAKCVDNVVAYDDTIMPISENVDKYQHICEVYRKIYP